MPQLLEIDELTRGQHSNLRTDDACYFMREHISRGGYSASTTNQLIANLKKELDRRHKPEWVHKGRAIRQAGLELRAALNADDWTGTAIVPMPPSIARTDPLYDDRMVQVGSVICAGAPGVVRELIYQRESRGAFHKSEDKRDIDVLIEHFQMDERQCEPPPHFILVLDDVLTTGAHFRAAKTVLQARFGNVPVVGLFIARRVFPQQVPDADDALAEAAAQAMLDERRGK